MSDAADKGCLSDDRMEELLDALCEQIALDESRPSVVDPERYSQMNEAYRILRALTQDVRGLHLTYELNKPFPSTGSITLEGKMIWVRGSKWFLKAAKLADNFEVYPLTNGRVRMSFCFNDLTTPIQ